MENRTTITETRHKGHVKFFNSIKGYGFILPDSNQSEEIFVHHTSIQNNGGFKSLAEGEHVEYDLVQGPKGMHASNVTGPNGLSVQGDPRTYRHPYLSDYNSRKHYFSGYMVNHYLPPYAYTIQGYPPFINEPPIYGGIPVPYHLPYGHAPSQNSIMDHLNPRFIPYPPMTMYSNYASQPPQQPQPLQQPQPPPQQTLITPPNKDGSSLL